MINSDKTVVRLLKQGWRLHRGAFSGWRVSRDRQAGESKVVSRQAVNTAQDHPYVIRTDDRVTRVGETWEYLEPLED